MFIQQWKRDALQVVQFGRIPGGSAVRALVSDQPADRSPQGARCRRRFGMERAEEGMRCDGDRDGECTERGRISQPPQYRRRLSRRELPAGSDDHGRVLIGSSPEPTPRLKPLTAPPARASSTPCRPRFFRGQLPSTDSGYGIRNFGVGMAVGFDWLYPALSPATRARVVASLNTWVDWYDVSDSAATNPSGTTSRATSWPKRPPRSPPKETTRRRRLFRRRQRPLFGVQRWSTGVRQVDAWRRLARRVGVRTARGPQRARVPGAGKTAKSLDWGSEGPQARDQASYFGPLRMAVAQTHGRPRHGSFGDEIAPSAALATEVATVLSVFSDASAGVARSFAADVVVALDDCKVWEGAPFCIRDDALPKAPRKGQPLSYAAPGPGHLAMRLSWATDAAWGALSSGTYINAPDSGEQMFNQGGLSVVFGRRPRFGQRHRPDSAARRNRRRELRVCRHLGEEVAHALQHVFRERSAESLQPRPSRYHAGQGANAHRALRRRRRLRVWLAPWTYTRCTNRRR